MCVNGVCTSVVDDIMFSLSAVFITSELFCYVHVGLCGTN